MCMEDIRLGRELGTEERTVTIADVTATAIAPPNNRRTRLILAADATATIIFGTRQAAIANNTGFTLALANSPYVLRIEEWGSLLRQQWWAIAPGGPVTIAVADANLEQT